MEKEQCLLYSMIVLQLCRGIFAGQVGPDNDERGMTAAALVSSFAVGLMAGADDLRLFVLLI